jgi:ABC-type glucose/galactose transport system permease subunit
MRSFIKFQGYLQAMRFDMMLSLLSSMSILFASMVRVIIHVALDADIMSECAALSNGEHVGVRLGIWGALHGHILGQSQDTVARRKPLSISRVGS